MKKGPFRGPFFVRVAMLLTIIAVIAPAFLMFGIFRHHVIARGLFQRIDQLAPVGLDHGWCTHGDNSREVAMCHHALRAVNKPLTLSSMRGNMM